MLPLFPVRNGQLITNLKFFKLIEYRKNRFQALIFSPEKKTPFRYYLTSNHQ